MQIKVALSHKSRPGTFTKGGNQGFPCVTCKAPEAASPKQMCRACAKKRFTRAVPEDFGDMIRVLTSAQAAKHYRSSLSTVTRWRREIGLPAHRPAMQGRAKRQKSAFFSKSYQVQNKIFSAVEMAADHLRRHGSVYRCAPSGDADAKGRYWNRAGHVLTDHEMLARAQADGWRSMIFAGMPAQTLRERSRAARDARIVLDYLRGTTQRAIGRERGLSHVAVLKVLRRAGVALTAEQKRARQSRGSRERNAVWPTVPTHLADSYRTLRRYHSARDARAKLDPNYRPSDKRGEA